ncbi:MAG TPA: ribokinase [Chloroflexi bacterium]|nr:ribokinase [Chloroflexota bacterium]
MSYEVDILFIGHFAVDKLVYKGKEEISSGGSVYYGAIAARRLGLKVAVVTRLHPDDFPRLEELKAEGILVYAHPAPQSSGIENVYYTEDMERRMCRPLGFAGPFSLDELPDLKVRIYLIGPIMAGEVDMPFLEAVAERGPVALDVQGFVRVREGDGLVFRDWPEKRRGLPLVRFLKADAAEAEVLTGFKDVRRAARQLAEWGASEVVLTHSGGVLVYAEGSYYEAPFKPRSMKGRTGRGDTCFATYVAKRFSSPPQEATRFAAALTSLKLEKPGPFRGTPGDVEELLKAWEQERIV